MATKASAAPRSEVVASQRDLLLATKLHVPRPRPGLVARPRLAERLDEGLGRGVVVVVAPAGYGKTVLLAEWTRSGACPAGWLSLDAGDNDPRRFWRHALVALEPVCPAISERVGPLAGSPAPPTFEPLVTALINDLVGDPAADEGLLVLDDYHLIRSDAVHASIGFLLEHRPPQLRRGAGQSFRSAAAARSAKSPWAVSRGSRRRLAIYDRGGRRVVAGADSQPRTGAVG